MFIIFFNSSCSISQCTGSQMLNAVNLTKHPRMKRHRNFVSVGNASQKNPQNRFVLSVDKVRHPAYVQEVPSMNFE